jgi:hypothetical protein
MKYEKAFYNIWEGFVNDLSDDDLDATVYMIKKYNELSKLVLDEKRYRTAMDAENA